MEQQTILNRLWLVGDAKEVGKVQKHCTGVDETNKNLISHMDFNKIIPMPADLDIEDDKSAALAAIFSTRPTKTDIIALDKHPLELNPKEFNLYLSYLKNMYNYRYINWFQWRMIRWNSAWNAYDTKVVDNSILFTTRFAPSWDVTLELSRQFKTIEFIHGHVEYETHKPGRVSFKDGVVHQDGFTTHVESSAFATNLLEDNK